MMIDYVLQIIFRFQTCPSFCDGFFGGKHTKYIVGWKNKCRYWHCLINQKTTNKYIYIYILYIYKLYIDKSSQKNNTILRHVCIRSWPFPRSSTCFASACVRKSQNFVWPTCIHQLYGRSMGYTAPFTHWNCTSKLPYSPNID